MDNDLLDVFNEELEEKKLEKKLTNEQRKVWLLIALGLIVTNIIVAQLYYATHSRNAMSWIETVIIIGIVLPIIAYVLKFILGFLMIIFILIIAMLSQSKILPKNSVQLLFKGLMFIYLEAIQLLVLIQILLFIGFSVAYFS